MNVGYFETQHQRNSARITGLIAVVLILLLFVVGPQYLDPPQEYGVAVNFGTNDFGSGNTPLSMPKKATKERIVEETQTSKTVTQTAESTAKSEDVLTQETAEAIALKKAKEEEIRAKREAERIQEEHERAEEKRRKEEAEKKNKLDHLISGVKNADGTNDGGEGPDNKGGNKGQLNGDPYAPSYFGGSGPGKGGVGFGLGGRGKPSRQIYKQDCNEYGLVVVRIEVDQQGKVVAAEPGIRGTTNTHPCLLEPAKKIALSHKWPADTNAPSKQIGFVSINFDVSQ